jgi:hypothetical protein
LGKGRWFKLLVEVETMIELPLGLPQGDQRLLCLVNFISP